MPDNAPRRRTAAVVAAAHLACGATICETAAAVGVDEKTLYRWRQNPAFRRRVARLRDAAIQDALGRLTASLTKAADTLVALLDSPDPKVRLSAARELLVAVSRLRLETELADRLTALENHRP